MSRIRSALVLCWLLLAATLTGETVTLATLNTYWFFNGDTGHVESDRPRDNVEYSTKAGHLIGLLPKEAPLFVGFEELGGGEDLAASAHSASARYHKPYYHIEHSAVFSTLKMLPTGIINDLR